MHTIHPLTLPLVGRSIFLSVLAFAVVMLLAGRLARKKQLVAIAVALVIVHAAWFVISVPWGAASADSFVWTLRYLCSIWISSAIGIVAVGVPLVMILWGVDFKRKRSAHSPVEQQKILEGRRQFLAGALPLAAVTASGLATIDGMRPFLVRNVEIKLRDLPRELDGFRIGQLTDLHVGHFIDPEHVQLAVEALDREGVHLQVMTGDLIDDKTRLSPTFAALDRCQAPYGMLAILGNHEKYFCLPEVLEAYKAVEAQGKIRLLVDSSVLLQHNGVPVRIVGVDYPSDAGTTKHIGWEAAKQRMAKSAEKGFKDVREGETILCLAHHPEFFRYAKERNARLTIAGHTHGGQIQLFGFYLFASAFPHLIGLFKEEGSQLYVSGGTGHWFPIRIGVPTEVTVLTLRRA